jgi:hypothetical protein
MDTELDLTRKSRSVLEEGEYTVIPVEFSLYQATTTSLRAVFYSPDADNLLFDYFGLSDRARWKLDNLLDALGLPGEGKITISKLSELALSRKFAVLITIDMYNGRKVNRIGSYLYTKELTDQDKVLQLTAKDRWSQMKLRGEENIGEMGNVLLETKNQVIDDILKNL